MKLIIGGAFQGKRDFAVRKYHLSDDRIVDGAVCELTAAAGAQAVCNLHLLIRRGIQEDTMDKLRDILESDQCPSVIICDELGYGIVPIDREDRVWRETTGRILSDLAGRAEHVSRIVCGLEQRLK